MRVYIRVPAAVALELLDQDFRDMHVDPPAAPDPGVWCDDKPRGGLRAAAGTGVILGGPEGDTVLCTDVPEEVFRDREEQEGTRPLTLEEAERLRQGGPEPEGTEYVRMGYAIIPADVLNRYGRPQLYDHDYSGCSRAELVQAIQAWEQHAADFDYAGSPESRKHAEAARLPTRVFDSAPARPEHRAPVEEVSHV